MEHISIKLGNDAEFDRAVHGDDKLRSLAQVSDLEFITKDDALTSGRAGIVVAFTVDIDGKQYRAQATTTVRNINMLAAALDGRYEDGMLREHLRK
jgi:hypothetical protein